MQFAYSQIFVISLQNGAIDHRGAASYYDMLGANAFVNFRTLLQNVAMHPMMGVYLTSIKNQKENPATGQHAGRELRPRGDAADDASGVVQLNQDGTPKRDMFGNTIPTYTHNDMRAWPRCSPATAGTAATPTSNTFIFATDPDASNTTAMSSYPAVPLHLREGSSWARPSPRSAPPPTLRWRAT